MTVGRAGKGQGKTHAFHFSGPNQVCSCAKVDHNIPTTLDLYALGYTRGAGAARTCQYLWAQVKRRNKL